MTRHKWLIGAALICVACSLFTHPKPPHGEFTRVEIPDGSLFVSRGDCVEVDLSAIETAATTAVLDMRAVWAGVYPVESITVNSMLVVMSVGAEATGIYWADEVWIELRCDQEWAIEFELYHAIAHRLGIWCWKTIGGLHGSLDCNINELTAKGIYDTIASSPDLG